MDLVHLLSNATEPPPTPPLGALSSEIFWFIVGIVSGAFVAAIGLFFFQYLYDRYKRPVLKIDHNGSPIPVTIHLDSGRSGISGDVTLNRIPYVVNRIRVLNEGKLRPRTARQS